VGGESATDKRADDGGDAEESAEEALDARTILERDSIDDANNLSTSAVVVNHK
jgi:hypothetical protein